jgi:hypothetical protein
MMYNKKYYLTYTELKAERSNETKNNFYSSFAFYRVIRGNR